MDLRTVTPDLQRREEIDRAMLQINTCIPGVIISFDPSSQTATVRPAVQMKTNVGGVEENVDPPLIVEVPLVFPVASTQGFSLTLPVAAGDPCLLVFSQRAIDNWHDLGGVQPAGGGGFRHHDMTDAFAILAPLPRTRVLTSWESSGIELRNSAKTSRVTVKNGTIEVECGNSSLTLAADGSITIVSTPKITITCPEVEVSGKIISLTSIEDPTGTMAEMRSVFNSHTHPETGTTTGQPNQDMS